MVIVAQVAGSGRKGRGLDGHVLMRVCAGISLNGPLGVQCGVGCRYAYSGLYGVHSYQVTTLCDMKQHIALASGL